jgi:MFS family permease
MLRALRYRNFRLFFGGQIVSLVGTWMTATATSWLVYRLTGSAFLLGILGFAGQLPAFLIGPFAGIYVDRWNRHRLLVLTQALSMLQSCVLAALTLGGHITIAEIVILNAFQGVVNAFDMPCRQAFFVSMIESKEDLGNAIALNSSMVNAARLVGPSIAGVVIVAFGEGWCFLIDGVSYLAVIAALFQMHVVIGAMRPPRRVSAFEQFKEGWTYAFGFRPIRSIITLLALTSLVGAPYAVLMPIFAGPILGGGPHTLGFLMTASGCGALLGALWLAARKSVLGLSRVISLSSAIFGIGLMAFSFSRAFWLSLACLVITGFGFMTQLASSNTVLQTIVEDEKRGRIMSFYMMAFLGTAPFGSLIAGTLSARIGAPHTVLLGGIGCIAGAVWFASERAALREAIRPIYVTMGILPELAAGLQNAAELTIPPEE